MSRKNHLIPLGLGVLAMCFIAPDALLIRLVEADQALSLGTRGLFLGLSVFMATLCINRGSLAKVLLVGTKVKILYGLSFGIGMSFFTVAVLETHVFNVLTIIMTAPILSAVGAHFIRKEPIDPTLWLVSFLVVVCVGAILWSDMQSGFLLGDLAAFVAAVSLAFNANLVRHHEGLDTLTGISLGGLIVAAVMLPASDFSTLGERDWIWLALNGLLVMPVASILLNLASKRLPPPEVNLLFVIEMVLSPLWIWHFLGEVPKAEVLVAGGMAGLVLVVYYAAKLSRTPGRGATLGKYLQQ